MSWFPPCGRCLQTVLGSFNFPVPTTDCRWPIIAAGRFSGSGRRGKVLGTSVLNQRCVGSLMSLAWEWSADGRSCRKDDHPDYPIAGETTHGFLVIREVLLSSPGTINCPS